jgi:hypothetical protein
MVFANESQRKNNDFARFPEEHGVSKLRQEHKQTCPRRLAKERGYAFHVDFRSKEAVVSLPVY